MGMFFLGVLRSGTIEQVRASLSGLDVEIAPVAPFVPEAIGPPSTAPADSVGPRMRSAPDVVRLAIVSAFPSEAWEHAATIAYGESGFNAAAHNTAGEDSRGLFQINVAPAANPDLLAYGDLFDPSVNAYAAYVVWKRQGWAAWRNVAIKSGIGATGPGIP